MIKNGKKHLGEDQEREQAVSTLRDFLLNMTNQLGELPKAYDSTTIFNHMIQDMLKTKFNYDA